MSVITEKMRVSKDFPLKVRFFIQKRNWYLFPQGFTCKGSMTKLRWNQQKSEAQKDVYSHDNFMIVDKYHFTWLFMHFIFETRMFLVSQEYYYHKKYTDLSNQKVKFEDINKN